MITEASGTPINRMLLIRTECFKFSTPESYFPPL
jgi:hypothetical protein